MTEHPLRRLFAFAKPYRGRLYVAGFAMVLYAAGTAGLAIIIRPIIDHTLPSKENLSLMAWGIIGIYLLKGGQPVTDYRNLTPIKNDPNYNELQPKALVPYSASESVSRSSE